MNMGRQVATLGLAVVFLVGAVFALQGLRVLPSARMYGKPEWIVIGAAMMVMSGGSLLRLSRR